MSQMKVNGRLGMISTFLEDPSSRPSFAQGFRLRVLRPDKSEGTQACPEVQGTLGKHDPPKRTQDSMNHCTRNNMVLGAEEVAWRGQ